ncbi:Paired amphipathic helix [Cinara cedri]|uniref:Paired amphipathic helix n=1 Tax=Cinara cedri TaxID=506608 RepID=A0A5E4NM34_9HEMI|nr:Paired amphipathic helix [Cinara cedri]
MDQCQIDGNDELKIPNDGHHETNMKSIKHISIKKNLTEADHRTPKRKNDISNLNTLKKKKKYETALAAVFPENDQSYLQYAQDYAEGYMKKLREKLDSESFDQAIKLLASFGDADDSNINLLYQQIKEVFTDKNEDLIYEFLGFLLPGQALSIGKFTDYLELTRIKEFIRKLQVCMKKQQTQVRKILDNLFHLSKNENVTPLEVHSVMLPLLKSNPILVDCFFQLIPTEHPPESFFSDDNWEDLDVDQSVNYGIDYEEIIPSDSEDHTLLNICHCICHRLGDNAHCRSCGLKFFKGRIYFDTPEGLKLAKINFEGADPSIVQSKIDKTKENITTKQKNRKSLIKNNSPSSAEDIKGSTGTESEEDLIDVKPKKRQKSKVVQSLKLKFKKEGNSKCKDDQDPYNESIKSIVHVNNEELNSSEMVFFCIPKAESSTKIVPKKKLKVDIKENCIKQELETMNQINSEPFSFNNYNSDLYKKNNDNNTEDTLGINTKNNILNKTKTEINCTSQSTIENIKKEDIKSEQHQIVNNINIELTSQSLITNNDLSVNSILSMPQKNLEESYKHIIKKEFIEYSNNSNIINKELCHNTDIKLTTDINKSVLDESATIKNKAIDNLSKCYLEVEKPENITSEKQLVNKWTIDEDKIILQTCKRVEDIEVLLETINRRIPQRSVSEIQERFTTLMTLLEQMIDVKQN